MLAARGVVIDAASRERLAAARDPDVIDRWIVRAATATSLADVLADVLADDSSTR